MSTETIAMLVVGSLMSALGTIAVVYLKQLVDKIDTVVEVTNDHSTRIAILESKDEIRKEVRVELSRQRNAEA